MPLLGDLRLPVVQPRQIEHRIDQPVVTRAMLPRHRVGARGAADSLTPLSAGTARLGLWAVAVVAAGL